MSSCGITRKARNKCIIKAWRTENTFWSWNLVRKLLALVTASADFSKSGWTKKAKLCPQASRNFKFADYWNWLKCNKTLELFANRDSNAYRILLTLQGTLELFSACNGSLAMIFPVVKFVLGRFLSSLRKQRRACFFWRFWLLFWRHACHSSSWPI